LEKKEEEPGGNKSEKRPIGTKYPQVKTGNGAAALRRDELTGGRISWTKNLQLKRKEAGRFKESKKTRGGI